MQLDESAKRKNNSVRSQHRIANLLATGFWIGVGLTLAAIATVAILSFRATTKLGNETYWVEHTETVLDTLKSVEGSVLKAESALRGYLLADQPVYLDFEHRAEAQASQQLALLQSLIPDNSAQQSNLRMLRQLIQQRFELLARIGAAQTAQGLEQAKRIGTAGNGLELSQAIADQIARMSEVENRLLRARHQEQVATEHTTLRIIAVGAVGSILLVCLIGLCTGWILNSLRAHALALVGREAELDRLNAELERRVEEKTAAAEQRAAELSRSQEILARQTRLLESILDGMSEAVVVADPAMRLVRRNPAAHTMLGIGPRAKRLQQLDGHFTMVAASDNQPCPIEQWPLVRALHGEELSGLEYRLRASVLPKEIDCEVSARPLRDQNGTITGALAVFRDVTERKRIEQSLHELNDSLRRHAAQLETANAELDSFSYSVSHDLRAPLRSIDGFSLALLEDYADRLDEQARSFLGRIRSATGRMGQLIDDLLNLGRVTRSEMHPEAVDLSTLARKILDEVRQREPDRVVECIVPDSIVAKGDRRLLQIVLENLLGNAWKFTSKKAGATVELGVEQRNGEPAYFVRDNGAGFNMTYISKLFGAFQRLHAMDEFPGNGVGLTTVRRIIHRHGGRVWGEGIESQGATFWFTLPGHGEHLR